AFGAERPVNDAAAVGVTERIGHLADQVETLIERKIRAVLPQIKIEARFAGLVLEEKRRSEIGFGVAGDFENSGMFQTAQDLVFASGGGFDEARVYCRVACVVVDAYAAQVAFDGGVGSGKILPCTLWPFA